jgi:hypothetical protein
MRDMIIRWAIDGALWGAMLSCVAHAVAAANGWHW